jgi:O-acetyl-ADP-ribose deacetylase (regulator of RNase III)
MIWEIQTCDILDIPADVLVCSANVYLNLSGGVGGSFLMRYGPEMQQWLHRYLADRNIRHVEQRELIAAPPCGSPYRLVLHAVAVDGFYDSSVSIVESLVTRSLRLAAESGANSVAIPAIATGYGKLTLSDFGAALAPLFDQDFPPLRQVVIGVRSDSDADDLKSAHPRLG